MVIHPHAQVPSGHWGGFIDRWYMPLALGLSLFWDRHLHWWDLWGSPNHGIRSLCPKQTLRWSHPSCGLPQTRPALSSLQASWTPFHALNIPYLAYFWSFIRSQLNYHFFQRVSGIYLSLIPRLCFSWIGSYLTLCNLTPCVLVWLSVSHFPPHKAEALFAHCPLHKRMAQGENSQVWWLSECWPPTAYLARDPASALHLFFSP